jgi:serine/threonine protein kinase
MPAAMLGAQALTNAGPLTPSTPTMNLSALGAPRGTLTQQGTIVGTFQYMAPEVLQGQEADARSDIFSFGAVLYDRKSASFRSKGDVSNQPRSLAIISGQELTPTHASLRSTISIMIASSNSPRNGAGWRPPWFLLDKASGLPLNVKPTCVIKSIP